MVDKIHTFVICAYKESEFLEECVQSLLKQVEYSEIILATSTPCDYITNICQKYHIPMYVNVGESGITQDWEFGISKVSTPIATIAHQDDIYFEGYAKAVTETYRQSKHPLIFFSDYYEIRNGKYIKTNRLLRIKRLMLLPLRIKFFQKSKWMRRRILSLGSAICCPSVAYFLPSLPRPLFQNHFRTNEDWEAWEKFSLLDGEFVYCAIPLMAHRIHAGSETTATIKEVGRSAEDYEMYRKFWPECIARFWVKCYKKSEESNSL